VKRLAAAAIGAVALIAAACSGVPNSSTPEVVRTGVGGPTQAPSPIASPQPGAEPVAIVKGFLNANVSTSGDKHAAAKQFLTPQARSKWNDTNVTVVDNYQVRDADPNQSTVTATANELGTIDGTGVYTPVVQGDGTGAQPQTLTFGLIQVKGQWRIDQLQPGVIIPAAAMGFTYQLHPLYFFDLTSQRLVADPRYSPLTDQALASWLLTQLFAGPRKELQRAVLALPDQLTSRGATATWGATTTIDLPGSSHLDTDTRRRIAGMLATTLGGRSATPITLLDGTRQVPVPGVPEPFSTDDFLSATGGDLDSLPVFIGDDGAVHSQDGRALDGPLGRKGVPLTAVALAANHNDTTNYRAAALTGPPASSRLLIGTSTAGLKDAGVLPGPLTRPTWAPGLSEVWLGDGKQIIRAFPDAPHSVVPLTVPTGQGGAIRAVKFSRDGVRIAIVIAGRDGTSECYVGTVERASNTVPVDQLVAVTPGSVNIADAAWNDDTTLYVVGTAGTNYGVWSVQDDGSQWTERSHANLPEAAQQIAAAPDQYPWVSAGGALFVQRSSSWVSPFGGPDATVHGTSPTYLEH
jgi:Lipoprotein LpqB beta-propeller domain